MFNVCLALGLGRGLCCLVYRYMELVQSWLSVMGYRATIQKDDVGVEVVGIGIGMEVGFECCLL